MVGPASLLCYLRERYLASHPGLRRGTVRQLEVAARLFERWAQCPVPPAQLSVESATTWVSWLAESRAPATVNSRRRALLTLWRAAWRDDMACRPDAERIPKLREPVRVPIAWRTEEVSRLLVAARMQPGEIYGAVARDFWPATILLCYDTAARIGAVMRARTADCNLGERWILLRAEAQKTHCDQWFPLSAQAVGALRNIYSSRRATLFPRCQLDGYLQRRFRRIVEAAGLSADPRRKDLFQKIRRTSLSYIARKDLQAAVQQAGHCRAELTIRHYLDPSIVQANGRRTVDLLPRI